MVPELPRTAPPSPGRMRSRPDAILSMLAAALRCEILVHHFLEPENLDQPVEADDRERHLSVEQAVRRHAKRAGADRDDVRLRRRALADLDLAFGRREFAQIGRERLRRKVAQAGNRHADVGVGRLRDRGMQGRRCARAKPQRDFDGAVFAARC